MKASRYLSAALAVTLVIGSLCGCGNASKRRTIGSIVDEEADSTSGSKAVELTMTIASNQTSQENPYHFGLQTFKEVLEELSGGSIEVICSDGDMSEDEAELISMLDEGKVQMVVCSPGHMTSAGVAEVDMLSLLYLFDGFSHWETAMDGEFGAAMTDIILDRTKNKYRIMGYWSAGVRDYYGKIPITSPADVEGLTIRTQTSGVVSEFWTQLGAQPVTVGWGDLYDALNNNQVDSAENDYTNLMLKEHHKTVNGKYICETHHDYTTRLFIINGDYYDNLTSEQKNWVNTAALAATLQERAVTYDMMDGSKAQCIAEGAVVTDYEDIDIDSFKEGAIAIQDNYASENGLQTYLEMIRKVK
ncbi:MAG: TRAP transporter substrate-binding protein [Bacteroidales bacterium]|nr:TRAP transporter substrate-binding protein [Lachnoclostridium sp.]MCM1384454.1 TRAP transporter substrate-binding protein [Lachnoclostridium sp.]MCM1465234.1 TRAP transporter substrate-binding protein [Bacteroidales bacterium]